MLSAAMLAVPVIPASAQIEAVKYQDTLKKTVLSKTYNFKGQYPHVTVSVKYDSASARNDTLRFYNIDQDTTEIYLLDSANNRLLFLTNSGDGKFHEWRLDKLCPDNVLIKYIDSLIYTTKFIFKFKGIKQ